jgi:hypothetical protein
MSAPPWIRQRPVSFIATCRHFRPVERAMAVHRFAVFVCSPTSFAAARK